jgi:predicted MFS family arabinose efflux permease
VGAALVACASLFILFLNRRSVADVQATHETGSKDPGGTFDFLRSPTVWFCFAFFFTVTLAFGALQNYSAPIFERVYGVSIPVAASALTAYLLASAAGTGTGGFFAAQGEGQAGRVAIALAIAAFAAGVLASAALPAMTLPALMAVMGSCVGFAGPSRDILVRRAATSAFGQRAFGRVYGFTYSGLDVGFAIAPLIFGPMMDGGRYTQVLWGAAILQLFAIATALTVGARSRVKSN